MDKIQSMRIFAKIAEQGSFHRAGTLLNISPAGISRHISDLELQLNARLLNRSTRKLSLTEVGQVYYGHVQDILSAIDNAESITTSMAENPQRKLRLYVQQTFGQFCLPEILSRYSKLHPETTLEVVLADRDVNLVDEGFDIGIYSGSQKINGSLIGRQLAITEVVLCASPAYLKKHGTPSEPHELSEHACLSCSFENMDKKWSLSRNGEDYLVAVTSKIVSNNLDFLRHYARDGAGIVASPSYSLEEDFRSGRLVRVLPEFHVRKLPLILAYPSRRLLPASVRTFADFMMDRFPFPERDPWKQHVLSIAA